MGGRGGSTKSSHASKVSHASHKPFASSPSSKTITAEQRAKGAATVSSLLASLKKGR